MVWDDPKTTKTTSSIIGALVGASSMNNEPTLSNAPSTGCLLYSVVDECQMNYYSISLW
jgi:hypothetical protein